MGVEHAQKQSASGSASGLDRDHEREHDPGMLHTAQLAKEHGAQAHAKPTVDSLSGEAMNDALMLVAHSLHGALMKSEASLRSGGTQVSIYNQNIEGEKAELDTAEQKYDVQLGKSTPSNQSMNKLSNQIDEHRDNVKNSQAEKTSFVAGVRDRVFEPLLQDPVRKLQDMAVEAQMFSWSADQHAKVAVGANQLRTMLRQIHEIGKNLELDSSPSLKLVEKALDDIAQSMKLTLSDADPKDLDSVDPYLLTQKSITDNLIAAEAQARNAQAAVRAWIGSSKAMNFGHVVGSVKAIEYHIEDATNLLAELKPADRHQFKARLHGLTREVEAVYHLGRIQPSGHAPAGSASMDIDAFPNALGALQKAMI